MNNEEKKIYSSISLAMKAGAVANGELSVMEAVKTEKAVLVIIAKDASDNTKKLFTDKSSFRKIPIMEFGTKDELGKAIGKASRSSLAITNKDLAGNIKEKISNLISEQ